MTLGESFKNARISIPEEDTTIKRILVRLAREQGLEYTVPNKEELVVESKAK